MPPGMPIRLDLPAIHTVADLNQAQDITITALNDGRITAGEARGLQDVVLEALRAGREAEPPRDPKNAVDAETRKRLICEAAAGLGMVWPRGTSGS